jgi:hypothetical protein
MPSTPTFIFNDSASFEQNIASFSAVLTALDPKAGPILSGKLSELSDASLEKPALLNSLFAALGLEETPAAAISVAPGIVPSSVPALTSPPLRWFIDGVEIEGFRGINNEGTPLILKFKQDCVSSVSAPNGVGKSSIFDAISFAIRGKIEKLERLLQSERPQDYYLNRFHPAGTGSIKLTFRPDDGGVPVTITVTRNSAGLRTVTGPAGVDAEALLAALNREFVLLDAQTFNSFIDYKALDRGRAFSGLLGLARYSTLRQELQALAHTRSFGNHFDVAARKTKKEAAQRLVDNAKAAIKADYEALVKEPLLAATSKDDAQKRCHKSLNDIPVLSPNCKDLAFMEVEIDACMEATKAAEGGPQRIRLASIIREQSLWQTANKASPTDADLPNLAALATARMEALNATSGDLMHKLYQLSKEILTSPAWPSPNLCPTCGTEVETSVLEGVQTKLGQYEAVEGSTTAVVKEWVSKEWAGLADLGSLTLAGEEVTRFRHLSSEGRAGTLLPAEATEMAALVATMRTRALDHLKIITAERLKLEGELPPSLVAVTEAVETARRLQSNWKALETAQAEVDTETARDFRVARLKVFLDKTSTLFAKSESDMAAARLNQVEPLCQELFKNIMYSSVVPALQKPQGSEEMSIRLSEFWSLRDVSAQALLSESYRNAFAVSVYLAAASLYGGAPRFIILDDVTSSFDAGHQYHLVEVIRTQFAHPVKADGPQVILFSHDTLLEKLFNKLSNSSQWMHQRLEGTARTAVLPQSGAVNKVRDATLDLLNSGRVDDAAPRVRQYLEYTLHDVISRCRIPVTLDLAFGDDKRTPGEYLKAIEAAVKLHDKASMLVLDSAQMAALQLHSTAIVGNFLSHWETGQTTAFSAPALLGVMQAIDKFPDCFKYEPAPGAPKKFYASLGRRI